MWPYLDADVSPTLVELLELASTIESDRLRAADRLPYDVYEAADHVRRLRAEATSAWQDWLRNTKKRTQ